MPSVTTPLFACAQCQTPLSPGQRVCHLCHSLQPARDGIAPGITIDRGSSRVVVDARIGAGGSATVWRGWVFRPPGAGQQGPPPEPIALKALHRRKGNAPSSLLHVLQTEAEALRRVSHPNILAYADLFEYGGSLVLAVEYVDGETLETVIARHVARARTEQGAGGRGLPALPMLRAWYYFQQLLGALAAIHALGIVHRDVKPSNVLLRRDGLVKLGDFGIARLAASSSDPEQSSNAQLQEETDAAGTGAYMSPEQVLSQEVDSRSDLYSAAVVLYEMLAGRPPFTADRPEFVVRRDQVETAPPPIRMFLPQAPPVLDVLFTRALAKDKALRFEGALEMGDAFRAALGLPSTPVWSAQADIARAARKIATSPDPGAEAQYQKAKLATLRDFVASGYTTMRLGSMG